MSPPRISTTNDMPLTINSRSGKKYTVTMFRYPLSGRHGFIVKETDERRINFSTKDNAFFSALKYIAEFEAQR